MPPGGASRGWLGVQLTGSDLAVRAAAFRRSDGRSIWQLGSTLVLFAAAWSACLMSLRIHYALTLLLAVPTGGLVVRLFVLQHDAGHGALFRSRFANAAVGHALGVLTLAPFRWWQRTHAMHHATQGRVDHLTDLGYFALLTTAQYEALTPGRQRAYRLYRSPWFLVLLGIQLEFLLIHRLPLKTPASWRAEWRSVAATNLGLLGLAALASQTVGLGALLAVHLPVAWFAVAVGGWLFYLQHTFEGAYYAESSRWRFEDAGLHGASYIRLPAVLAWFTGHIGLHHVHHLQPQIPNYRLEEARAGLAELAAVRPLTWAQVVRAGSLAVWDPARGLAPVPERAASASEEAA